MIDGTGEPAPAESKEHPYQGENALQLITLDRLAKKLRAARFKMVLLSLTAKSCISTLTKRGNQ